MIDRYRCPGTRGCAELRHELGVYVLGATAPADRSAVESHLASCAGCRDQLADLAGLPALLRRVPRDEVDAIVVAAGADGSNYLPNRSLGSLLSQAAKRKRRRVWSELTAAACVALAAVSAALYGALAPSREQAGAMAPLGATTVRGSNPLDDASAVVKYAGEPWGTQLYVQVNGVTPGTKCAFEVSDSTGHESAAGGWTIAAGHEDAWYAESSSVPVTSVRGFVVTAGAHALVRIGVPVAPTRIAALR